MKLIIDGSDVGHLISAWCCLMPAIPHGGDFQPNFEIFGQMLLREGIVFPEESICISAENLLLSWNIVKSFVSRNHFCEVSAELLQT